MSFNISGYPDVPPPIESSHSIITGYCASPSNGFYRHLYAINSMYSLLKPPLFHASYGIKKLHKTGGVEYAETRISRPDNRSGTSADYVEVWAWVIRTVDSSSSSWELKIQNDEISHYYSAEVNGGNTTAADGEWVSLGHIRAYHDLTDFFQTFSITCVDATSLGADDAVYAVSIIPYSYASVLPNSSGGYDNGFIPTNIVRGYTDHPVEVAMLRNMHRNLVIQYQYAAYAVVSTSYDMKMGAKNFDVNYDYWYYRGLVSRLEGCTSLRGKLHCNYDTSTSTSRTVFWVRLLAGTDVIGSTSVIITGTGDFYFTLSLSGVSWATEYIVELQVGATYANSTIKTYFDLLNISWTNAEY